MAVPSVVRGPHTVARLRSDEGNDNSLTYNGTEGKTAPHCYCETTIARWRSWCAHPPTCCGAGLGSFGYSSQEFRRAFWRERQRPGHRAATSHQLHFFADHKTMCKYFASCLHTQEMRISCTWFPGPVDPTILHCTAARTAGATSSAAQANSTSVLPKRTDNVLHTLYAYNKYIPETFACFQA